MITHRIAKLAAALLFALTLAVPIMPQASYCDTHVCYTPTPTGPWKLPPPPAH